MTASTAESNIMISSTEDSPSTTTNSNSSSTTSHSLKAKVDKEISKARREAFSRLRTLSNSFSKQHRCSHNKKVRFDLEKTDIHVLPPNIDRTMMFMSYQDKVNTADDVEETCYQYNDSDFVHPYVSHLRSVWEKCGSSDLVGEVKSGNPTRASLDQKSSSADGESESIFTQEDLNKLTNTRGRGLEKKLLSEIKRQRDGIYKQVLETQKSYGALPYGARAKMIKNKYKKSTIQSKIFALTMAMGDAQLAQKSNQGNYTIAATSA